MAVTQLADIYDPLVFNPAVQEAAIELNRFVQSGVMVADPIIGAMATNGGSIGELPFYFGLDNTEPNYSSDNPASDSTPRKIASGKQIYRKSLANDSWSTMDIAQELALQDPLQAIVNRIGKFWAVYTEQRLIQSALGVMADNIANDASDMVNAIQTETGSTADASNQISAEAILDTKQTMGDHGEMVQTIAMHSIQFTSLQKQNLIDYIPDSMGVINIPTYLGYRVVVDDSMPVRAGTVDGFVYTVMLVANGVFAYGQGTPEYPSELDRKPESGDGGGQTVLHSRTTEIVHPYGFQFTSASVAAQSATYAELADAANWDRVYANRKNVGIAFLTCN